MPFLVMKKENSSNAIMRNAGMSKSAILISNLSVEIEALNPIGTRMSKMVLPIIVPPERAAEPLSNPPTATAISGKLVPKPIIKMPIID